MYVIVRDLLVLKYQDSEDKNKLIDQIVSQVLTGLLWVLIPAIIGVVLYVILVLGKYKHQVIIKDSVRGTKLVFHDKFKELRKKDGTIWWKLKKLKKEIVPAKKECVEIDHKGRMFAQFYRLDGDTFIPAKDTFDPADKKSKEDIIKTIQPFGSNERALMVNQHVKAEREKKKSIGDMLLTAVPYMAVIMILVLFMIFFNDAVKPMKEVGSQFEAVSVNLVEATDKLDAIIHDRVYLEGENVAIDRTEGAPD